MVEHGVMSLKPRVEEVERKQVRGMEEWIGTQRSFEEDKGNPFKGCSILVTRRRRGS